MDEQPNAAPPAPAKATIARDVQPPAAAPAAKLSADELVRKHVGETSKRTADELPDDHLLVREHVEAAGLELWAERALYARFHAHGLTPISRIHPEVFARALGEALHRKG